VLWGKFCGFEKVKADEILLLHGNAFKKAKIKQAKCNLFIRKNAKTIKFDGSPVFKRSGYHPKLQIGAKNR
jgi:hypothetical protein